ncbi:MAG: 2,3-diphosphoglycerate-dependent phosphoglycerate mutase [Candidatus Woesearchaeota archaeon]
MATLILLRHGQSQWNQENRFTGWTDVDLSLTGKDEALRAGQLLKQHNLMPSIAFSSLLKRAIHTCHIVLDELDRIWIPIYKDVALNERHYGALQGLNKEETAKQYSAEQVFIWRRSYDVQPPALDDEDERHPQRDTRYVDYTPATESLHDTVARVIPYFEQEIAPYLQEEKTVLIAAHGNSLRALMKHLEQISDTDITQVELPTGKPLIYELDDILAVKKKYFLE